MILVLIAKMGLEYQGQFQTVEEARITGNQISGRVRMPETNATTNALHCPPSLVDGGLQLLALAYGASDKPPVPIGIDRLTYFGNKAGSELLVKGELFSDQSARLVFYSTDKEPVLELSGINMMAIPRSHANDASEKSLLHTLQWVPFEMPEEGQNVVDVQTFGTLPQSLENVITTGKIPSKTAGVTLGLFGAEDQMVASAASCQSLVDVAVEFEAKISTPVLIVTTQNAWRVKESDASVPAQAALWGVARTLKREKPNLKVICIDLDGSKKSADALAKNLATLPVGGELAIRDGEFVIRELHVALHKSEDIPQIGIPLPDQQAAVLEVTTRGGINGLRYCAEDRREPDAGELEVQFESSSLNFKDILKVMGRLNEQTLKQTFFHSALGMETCGTVVRTGEESPYNVGERVIVGLRSGGLRTHATFSPDDAFVLRWGDLDLTSAELAALPISYITAHYGLKDMARLKKSETVLLHSATGGVGHAALQVAQSIGANIIATAGTEKKRQYLRDLGVENVFDSRSLDFEDAVLDLTDGRGVDAILNFLPEALLHANLRILAPFGRLVEIGKADIGANKGLPLAEFERNLTFAAVDIDQMLAIRRDLFYAVAQEVKNHFDAGDYHALPVHADLAENTIGAFKEFAEGNHIGKRALNLKPGPQYVLPKRPAMPSIKADASYIVTGGFTGFGLKTAQWLAEEGANYLVLASRTPRENEEIAALRKKLESQGGQLLSVACDISDKNETEAAIAQLIKKVPSVRGIFHAAAVLADAPIDQLEESQFASVLKPKAEGALNLHNISVALELPLDHFVLYSSISGMVGNSGQGNYAAANAYLDALAEYRRSQGLPATSVAWGALGEVGMVARDETVAKFMERKGITPLSMDAAMMVMAQVLVGAPPSIGAFLVDWDKWGKTTSLDGADPIAILIGDQSSNSSRASIIEKLKNGSDKERLEIAQEFLRETLSEVINVDKAQIPLEKPLIDLGVDSLMSIEFQLALEGALSSPNGGIQWAPQASIVDISTSLIEFVDEQASGSQSDDDAMDVDVDSLSDSDVEELLEKLLADGTANEELNEVA